jgi:hypothetical protein
MEIVEGINLKICRVWEDEILRVANDATLRMTVSVVAEKYV